MRRSMEGENQTVQSTDESKAPVPSFITPIYVNKTERFAIVLSYVAAYLYVLCLAAPLWRPWLALSAAALTAWGLLGTRNVPAPREHWLWLGGLWLCVLGVVLERNRVWGDISVLTLHLFALYWLIVRSGLCAEGGSSRFLPLDVWVGAAWVPLRALTLRLRVLRGLLAGRIRGRLSGGAALGTAMAFATAGVLFAFAARLLASADPNFSRLAEEAGNALRRFDASRWLLYLLLSLPVGAYLFGLIHGAPREPQEARRARRERVEAALAALRRVPRWVWPLLLGGFTAMYLTFILLQGSYLFSALASILPERFTAAQYARQGFFELCAIMALNFALLAMAALSAEGGLRHGAARALATVLLAESLLFAVTAGAKLWLYIDRFGFTPLRLQSSWLVTVLAAGCAAALAALWTGRDTTRPWLLFTGMTLALLHLY